MKIQYVIAIYLVRWLTNFYDFMFKWTATAAIGIHPTKAWLSQLVNFKNTIWTLEERYAIKFCFQLGKNAMRWKLDLLLWPRDQETEFPVEACWLSQTQEGQIEQILPQTLNDPFFFFFFFFFFGSTGMIYMHGVPTGQTVNKEYYVEVLREFSKRFRRRRPALFKLVSGISTRTIHQSTTPSLSQTIWASWASRQFLTLPIVETLFPVTFGYSLSSEAVVMQQLGRWKGLWWRSLTRSHQRTSMVPFRSCWNGTTCAMQLEEIIS